MRRLRRRQRPKKQPSQRCRIDCFDIALTTETFYQMLYVGVTVDHGIGTSRASGASSYLLLIFVNSCKSLRVLPYFALLHLRYGRTTAVFETEPRGYLL